MAHSAFARTDHRPWPVPSSPWMGRQTWHDLLFAHWPVPVESLRRFVPPPLTIQERDGTSWVAVVPFRMSGVTARGLPALPWLSAFPELNVRLYVEYEGRPGVWFLSLDATNPLAVWAARRFFHLPYQKARMSIRESGGTIEYHSERMGARFAGSYAPTSDVQWAEQGSLDHWLTERYCLYAAAPDGSLWRCEVHHAPWPLQRAHATIRENTLLEHHGIEAPSVEPLLHFSRRLDVVVWPPRRVSAPSSPDHRAA